MSKLKCLNHVPANPVPLMWTIAISLPMTSPRSSSWQRWSRKRESEYRTTYFVDPSSKMMWPMCICLPFYSLSVMTQITSPSKRFATSPAIHIDPNGNQDSGYAPSNIDDIVTVAPMTPPGSPRVPLATVIVNRAAHSHQQNNSNNNYNRNGAQRSPKKEPHR